MKEDASMTKVKKQKASESKAKKKLEEPISLYPLDFEQALKGLLVYVTQRTKTKKESILHWGK